MKKYLISIEEAGSPRLNNFFIQDTFRHEIENFKIFGVIGKQLSVGDYFDMAVAGKRRALTPGELGCSLSHIAALKDFINSDDEYAICFEDDAIERFPIDLEKLNEEIISLQLKPCFFLSLGGIQFKICNRVRGRYLDQTLGGQKIIQIDPDFLENLSYAYAYMVDRKMAQLLLQYHQTPQVYDHWQELTEQNTAFTFYATYLFDHPVVEKSAMHLSYLEQERNDCSMRRYRNRSSLRYWRRKFKKILLAVYQS